MNSSEERIPGLGMAVAAEQVQTDEVFRVHAARLYPVAFRLTGNASDAEDLVQETFAKAFAAAGWFQLGTNLSAWLHCIMISAFITSCRRTRNEPLLGVEGRSDREIADLTGIPLSSVKSSLHRARCRLRAELCAFAPGASPVCRRPHTACCPVQIADVTASNLRRWRRDRHYHHPVPQQSPPQRQSWPSSALRMSGGLLSHGGQ